MKKGGVMNFYGLGRFYVGRRPTRSGRNPRTGATILIPAAGVPRFHASKTGRPAASSAPASASKRR